MTYIHSTFKVYTVVMMMCYIHPAVIAPEKIHLYRIVGVVETAYMIKLGEFARKVDKYFERML